MHNKKTKLAKITKIVSKMRKKFLPKIYLFRKNATVSLMQNSVELRYQYYWMQHQYRPHTLSGFRCVLGEQPCCNCHRLRQLKVELLSNLRKKVKDILARTFRKPCPTSSKIKRKMITQTQLQSLNFDLFSFFLFYIMYHQYNRGLV